MTARHRAAVVPLDQTASLVERMLSELRDGLTKHGHLAQRVTTESMGLCSLSRGESPGCLERRALIAEAERYLAVRWLDKRKAG